MQCCAIIKHGIHEDHLHITFIFAGQEIDFNVIKLNNHVRVSQNNAQGCCVMNKSSS